MVVVPRDYCCMSRYGHDHSVDKLAYTIESAVSIKKEESVRAVISTRTVPIVAVCSLKITTVYGQLLEVDYRYRLPYLSAAKRWHEWFSRKVKLLSDVVAPVSTEKSSLTGQ